MRRPTPDSSLVRALIASFVAAAVAASGAYAQSIADYTAQMDSQDGFIPLHWDDETGRLLLEIRRFDEDFLYLQSQATGLGSNRLGLARGMIGAEHIVRFEGVGPKVHFVLPNPERQAECMALALRRARMNPDEVDIVSTHATGTASGDVQECQAVRRVFGESPRVRVNNAKSFIGHSMGAAGALELAGNLPSFVDRASHATINVDELDPECELAGLVINEPREVSQVNAILNNSFGMLGINSVVIVKRV